MRVNISYSAELDEVPAELSRLIVDVADRLGSHAGALLQVEELLTAEDGVDNAAIVADLIDSTRQALTGLDTRLSESVAILGGYYQAKTNPESLLPSEPNSTDIVEQAEQLSSELSETRGELEEFLAETDNGVSSPTQAATTEAETEEAEDATV